MTRAHAVGSVATSVALFVVAAKVHGRHLRLERERAGFWSVRFGAENAPWVEALWRSERVRFWVATAACVGLVALARRAGVPLLRSRLGLGIAALSWAPSTAFLVTGAWSATRTALASASPGADAAWAGAAVRGSAAWWSAALALSVVAWKLAATGAEE